MFSDTNQYNQLFFCNCDNNNQCMMKVMNKNTINNSSNIINDLMNKGNNEVEKKNNNKTDFNSNRNGVVRKSTKTIGQ